jgi:hypothetical protein
MTQHIRSIPTVTPLILINYNDVMFVKDIDVVAREATQHKSTQQKNPTQT